jgi:hypothetical protein
MNRLPVPSARPRLQLLLAVGGVGAASRWLWRSRVVTVDTAIEASFRLVSGQPRVIGNAPDERAALQGAMGVPCRAGIIAEVPGELAGPMSSAMHLALVAYLGAIGDLPGAHAIEQGWALRRRPRKGFRATQG